MIYFSAAGLVNSLGDSLEQISDNLSQGNSGLKPSDSWLLNQKSTWVGEVNTPLPQVPPELARHDSRNNRLLMAALSQIQPQLDEAIVQFGPERIAVVMGTSTSGIHEGELAVNHQLVCDQLPKHYHYQQQELGDPAMFLAALLGLNGPAYTLSTACSSSVRAIISGYRLIMAGLADAALVGGADSLCRMAINGFDSLESISSQRCLPFAEGRNGINIGESAGLVLLTRQPAKVALLGMGESSDAWHMSAPHPQGEGAERAMRMALDQAGLEPHHIGYINLHGTATQLNDLAEGMAVNRVFGSTVPCSSTKHLTGHTLGAAGITEAILCWLILSRDLTLPVQDFSTSAKDAAIADIHLLTSPEKLTKKTIISNSFAFGGNNACVLLGEAG
ncbi:3-oxoacyl-[acyl-carrier-protein] synthase 2 [Pragia fontium]|uniref:beta-ketoacyl-[acyl-carrier-protein] synthase family protein n=1 Tax=Pragia fontium TaxID=82985 RepID=UPI000E074598|nr:beta-ketoacyl-[acyl-carrier-protein] synthase family protein [Pragia fontium]SUB84253.1 3-oxoacyl-[acyl-carrier-protein] synthase 2 [Pragia fontium]